MLSANKLINQEFQLGVFGVDTECWWATPFWERSQSFYMSYWNLLPGFGLSLDAAYLGETFIEKQVIGICFMYIFFYFLARKMKKELIENTLITYIKDRWSVLVRGILEHTSQDVGFSEGSLPRTVTDNGSACLQLRSELCAMGLTVV